MSDAKKYIEGMISMRKCIKSMVNTWKCVDSMGDRWKTEIMSDTTKNVVKQSDMENVYKMCDSGKMH